MNKKILLGSIIAVVILTIPISTAVDVRTDNENDIEQVDNTFEVISFIRGNLEVIDGDNGYLTVGHISGRIHPAIGINIRAFTINPLKLFYAKTAMDYIDVPHVIGFVFWLAADNMFVAGIALGNIEWS